MFFHVWEKWYVQSEATEVCEFRAKIPAFIAACSAASHTFSEKSFTQRVFLARKVNNISGMEWNSFVYKITKIVRALWLAERSVCMTVCKHGCGVKLFGFSRANHASTNLNKFSSSKLDKFTLFTHSFVGWNLENPYKEGVSIFSA